MAGEAVYRMEYLDDRDHWRVRRENGGTLPIEGADRDDVLERAEKFAREHAPSILKIEDRKGMVQDEKRYA